MSFEPEERNLIDSRAPKDQIALDQIVSLGNSLSKVWSFQTDHRTRISPPDAMNQDHNEDMLEQSR